MKTLLLAAAGAALFGLVSSVSPTAAAPAQPVQIDLPDSGVEQAQMSRRERMVRRGMMRSRMMRRQRMMNRRMMRSGMMRRGMMMRGRPMVERSSDGSNVSQPSRRVPQTGPGGGGGSGR